MCGSFAGRALGVWGLAARSYVWQKKAAEDTSREKDTDGC